jgi:hypothetical protein
VLVCLPLIDSYSEKIKRLATARDVFQRHITRERDRKTEREAAAELKVAALSLAPGNIVTHDKFGSGTVVSTTGHGATAEALIDFGIATGVKHLVLSYAPLKKLR